MSIQDESFPYDDDLEFSHNSGKNFVFPHHKPRRSNGSENMDANKERDNSSLPLQSQDESTQSSNDLCISSETSGKTSASEPNNLKESENKKPELVCHNASKSNSYHDIHSEYTKRRYKHVESKVGQYIANMKAQDEKRRNSGKFQRHSSMPETLHGRETTATDVNNNSKKHGLLRRTTNDLHRMHNEQSDNDMDNYDNLTNTKSSVFARDLVSENDILLDKETYEQLLSDKERKDYLQNKLEEKNAENWRLKQNLDTMRIEYSMCKDKLKKQMQSERFSGSIGSINVAASLAGTTLQSLLCVQKTIEKSTQTDIILTPSPILLQNKPVNDMFATPFTPDSNNNSFNYAAVGILAPAANKVSKCIATIQPLSLNFSNLVDQDFNSSTINTTMGFLRQRSNSLAIRKKSTPLPANISKNSSAVSSGPSSSDSAIDIEVSQSPKSQRQNRREEFVYYEQHSQRYEVVETHNEDENYTNTEDNNKRNRRKRHNLRSRLIRFFGACTKCEEGNKSVEAVNSSLQSQIPLLERSTQNYCYNVR